MTSKFLCLPGADLQRTDGSSVFARHHPVRHKVARVQLSAGLPGVVTPPHCTTNRVGFFDPGTNKITYQNGRSAPKCFGLACLWNNAMSTHVAEIVAAGPVNIAHIELKSRPMVPTVTYPAHDPLKVDPAHYKVEIDNNQVRVLRLRLKQGEKTALHEEVFERLLVPLSAARLKIVDSGGKAKTVTYKRAELQWLQPGAEADENLAGQPYEALIVEFKK
jgi:hypothetical protein